MRNVHSKPIDCPLCKQNNYVVLYNSTLQKGDFDPKVIQSNLKNTLDNYHKHSRIVRCKNCNLVYTNPMENFSQLLKGYKEVSDPVYLETEKYRKLLLNQHLNYIEQFKKSGKMLDVGCFAGFFLELAKQRGWKSYGIEPSEWASTLAKKRNIQVIGKDIDTVKLKNNFYDSITFWDVIEHLPNPRATLQKCYKATAKKGIIALGTPNIESFVANTLKNHNPYLIRMHLVFYSPKTITKLLEEVGYKTIKVYNYGRTFPISYILDLLKTKNKLYQNFKNLVNSSSRISEYPLYVNIGDSFGIIAQKQL